MKKTAALIAALLVALTIFVGCGKKEPTIPSFSYDEVEAKYADVYSDDVQRQWFENTDVVFVETAQQAEIRASAELEDGYDSASVAYDSNHEIYRVAFTKGGDTVTVYMSNYGITRLIVYGE